MAPTTHRNTRVDTSSFLPRKNQDATAPAMTISFIARMKPMFQRSANTQ